MRWLKAALFTVMNQGVTQIIILIMISNSWSPALVYMDRVSTVRGYTAAWGMAWDEGYA